MASGGVGCLRNFAGKVVAKVVAEVVAEVVDKVVDEVVDKVIDKVVAEIVAVYMVGAIQMRPVPGSLVQLRLTCLCS